LLDEVTAFISMLAETTFQLSIVFTSVVTWGSLRKLCQLF
jgi:hypothetical protein